MQTTIHEALLFSAKLRLTDVTDKNTLEAFVNEVGPSVDFAALRGAGMDHLQLLLCCVPDSHLVNSSSR